jgi:hypothetical protein
MYRQVKGPSWFLLPGRAFVFSDAAEGLVGKIGVFLRLFGEPIPIGATNDIKKLPIGACAPNRLAVGRVAGGSGRHD